MNNFHINGRNTDDSPPTLRFNVAGTTQNTCEVLEEVVQSIHQHSLPKPQPSDKDMEIIMAAKNITAEDITTVDTPTKDVVETEVVTDQNTPTSGLKSTVTGLFNSALSTLGDCNNKTCKIVGCALLVGTAGWWLWHRKNHIAK